MYKTAQPLCGKTLTITLLSCLSLWSILGTLLAPEMGVRGKLSSLVFQAL